MFESLTTLDVSHLHRFMCDCYLAMIALVTKALPEKEDLAKERTNIAPGAEVPVIETSVNVHVRQSKRLGS